MLVMPGLITADPEMFSTLEFVEVPAVLPSSVSAGRWTNLRLKKAFSGSVGDTAGGSEQSLT